MGFQGTSKVVFSMLEHFPPYLAVPLSVVSTVSSQNGGDKAQHIATTGSQIRECSTPVTSHIADFAVSWREVGQGEGVFLFEFVHTLWKGCAVV